LALRRGLHDLVKASITGSIIANVLLVFGGAAIAGGIRHRIVKFNRTAASLGTTMLVLSAIGLVVPAFFHTLSRRDASSPELRLDTEIAAVLLGTYLLYLVFTLKTHRALYTAGKRAPRKGASSSLARSVMRLGLATVAVALVAETLLNSLGAAAQAMH